MHKLSTYLNKYEHLDDRVKIICQIKSRYHFYQQHFVKDIIVDVFFGNLSNNIGE